MPKYEKILPCSHCKERQSEREITHQQKLYVIENSPNELPCSGKKRRKFWGRVDGSKLTVVIKEVKNGKEAIIITAYWND